MAFDRSHTVIHPDAQIGENVYIGPFTFIDRNVVIGDNSWIGPNVTIFEGARLGKDCKVFPGAVISGVPQDLKFQGEESLAIVGDRTTIREYVTINRGTKYAGETVVGSDCLIMAYAHVAHDCIIGDRVILANNVNLAGHVEIEDWAILEGLVAVQQFIRIGQHSFIGGGSLVRKNVPPYVKAAREPLSFAGVNVVGLRRRKFSDEQIKHIQEIYRILYVRGYNTRHAIQIIEDSLENTIECQNILSFIKNSAKETDNGLMRGLRPISNIDKIDEN